MFLSDRAQAALSFLEGERLRGNRPDTLAKSWQCVSLTKRLKKMSVCRSELDAWEALGELRKQGYLASTWAIESRSRVSQKVAFSEREQQRLISSMRRVSPALDLQNGQIVQWERALNGLLADWSLEDQRRLAEGFRRLESDTPEVYELTAFQASARYLLGSSKLLGSLQPLARTFEIDISRFARPVVRVLVSSPDHPERLLLIENPQSFDQACRCGLNRRIALVCSFGYGLSLAEALDRPDDVRLIGDGQSTPDLSMLLSLPQPAYWGDLDPEGFRIYQRLKLSVPRLALSALYGPMIDAMADGIGHPLSRATGKRGQIGTEAARGLDQEYLDDDAIGTLAGQAIPDGRWPDHLRDAPA